MTEATVRAEALNTREVKQLPQTQKAFSQNNPRAGQTQYFVVEIWTHATRRRLHKLRAGFRRTDEPPPSTEASACRGRS